MADTTSIKDEINKIYKADIQSIRNLEAISKKLQEGGLTVSGDLTVDGNIKVKKNLEVKEKTTTKMLDIPSSKGTTHFNHHNKGDNYLSSGTNFLDGLIRLNNDLAISGKTTTKMLDIPSSKGTTHFNHQNKGVNFLRSSTTFLDGIIVMNKDLAVTGNTTIGGKTNLKGMLYGTNFQFYLGNQGYIKTAPNSAQLVFYGSNGCRNR